MRPVQFEKWEGLGNDFIVLDLRDNKAPSAESIRRLCDRRRGIGADGMLLVEKDSSTQPRMTVYNADGSRPEMCGNGLRCVAAYLARSHRPMHAPRRDINESPSQELVIATDAGDRHCIIQEDGFEQYQITVDMGRAQMRGEISILIDGREHRFLTMDVGNPHAITFEPHDEASIERVAPIVATSLPGGTNVELCSIVTSSDGPRVQVVVWERGVGRTLACGTGACAVAAAACEMGKMPFGVPIQIALPGGDLEVTVFAEHRELVMRGPARRVFGGELVSL